MKLTAEADFFIKKYGPEAGVKYLKELGYQNIIYTISHSYTDSFNTEWADRELESTFSPIRKAVEATGIKLLFTVLDSEIYRESDTDEINDARKKLCIQAVKATAYMGCKILAVQPVCLRYSIPNAWEITKELTYNIYSEIKQEADKFGVKLAFINNSKELVFSSGTYGYGCRASELLELADAFESKVIINPCNALKAGERVEEMIAELGDKLLAFLINDKALRTQKPALPMMGCLDYYSLIEYFKKHPSNTAVVMMYSYIMKRYNDFLDDQELVEAISNTFYKVACVVSGCKIQRLEKGEEG